MAGGGTAVAAGSVTNDALGRFKGSGDLTPQQEAFVSAYFANGGRAAAAAEAAGYAFPAVEIHRLLAKPHVAAAIHFRMVQAGGPLAMAATEIHQRILDGEQEASGPLVAALRLAYERAGLIGRNAKRIADDGGKPLGDMSLAEIRAELAAAQAVTPGQPDATGPERGKILDISSD